MILDLIAALATGFALMGIAMVINRYTGRWMGGWVFPAMVALGMVGYTVWAEYTWASRQVETQPQLRIASTNGETVFYRPWTYLWPQVTRMITVDLSETRVHENQPDRVLTRLVLIGKWQPVRAVSVLFDCAAPARVDLAQGAQFQADGSIEDVVWLPLEAEDPVMRTACDAGEEIRNGQGSDS